MVHSIDPYFKLFIGTLIVLVFSSLIVYTLTIVEIIKFRRQLEPGDYAKVKTQKGMIRAKLMARNIGEKYLFESLDTKDLILTIPANIYRT